MKKILPKTNFRIVVEITSLRYASTSPKLASEYWHDRTKDAVDQIKRHVDGIHDIKIEFDEPAECDNCRADWIGLSSTYNGGCCHADEANAPQGAEA